MTLQYHDHNQHLVWTVKRLLNSRAPLTGRTELYVVHINASADDQGGLANRVIGQTDVNTDFVGISPHLLEGEFPEFVGTLLMAESDDDIKAVCAEYPHMTIYYTMGISTYPLNDKNVNYRDLAKKLESWNIPNLYVAFVNGWDMYTDEFEGFDRCDKINEGFKSFGHAKLKFLMANHRLCIKYRRQLPQADVQYFTIYPSRIADSPGKASWPKSIIGKTGNKLRSKKLVCLNNYEKEHRTAIVDTIKPYERDIYYSYRADNIFLKKESVFTRARNSDPKFLRNQDSPPYRVISNAYAWIANETFFSDEHSPSPAGASNGGWGVNPEWKYEFTGFITEKTLKGFFFELPLLVVGLPKTYDMLHQLGFETFPEIFNEDFDIIESSEERMAAIKETLINFLDTPLQEIHEKFFSPVIQEKIAHNKERIRHRAKTDPFNSYAWKYKYPGG